MNRRTPRLAVLMMVGLAALAGCTSATSGSGTHAGSTAASTSSAPSTSAAMTPASASSSAPTSSSSTAGTPHTSGTTKASIPQCTSDIRVIPGTVEGAAGHRSLVLVFNNVSHTQTCTIFGYPGVDLVTAGGTAVAHLRRTLRGMAGGEPTASRLRTRSPSPPARRRPPSPKQVTFRKAGSPTAATTACSFTVPNQFVSVSGGTAMLPRCDAQIHPVVPGTGGGMA